MIVALYGLYNSPLPNPNPRPDPLAPTPVRQILYYCVIENNPYFFIMFTIALQNT